MHASTASGCLRKLSDWVNSVSKHHAAFRSIMFSCFLRLLTCLIHFLRKALGVSFHFILDIHRGCASDYASGFGTSPPDTVPGVARSGTPTTRWPRLLPR